MRDTHAKDQTGHESTTATWEKPGGVPIEALLDAGDGIHSVTGDVESHLQIVIFRLRWAGTCQNVDGFLHCASSLAGRFSEQGWPDTSSLGSGSGRDSVFLCTCSCL